MSSNLVGLGILEKFIRAIILTGRLEESRPVSAVIIADPESGKTSVVTNNTCTAIVAVDDITASGLINLILEYPEASHIALTDMTAVTAHKDSVKNLTLSLINAMTEEGLKRVAWLKKFDIPEESNHKGIIGCMTTLIANDKRSWWHKSGFTSRMVPFAFKHGKNLIIEVKNIIDKDGHNKKKRNSNVVIHVPKNKLKIKIKTKYARKIRIMADRKSIEMEEQGYRRLKQFRSLARGNAIAEKRKSVNDRDMKFLEEIMPYISYDKPKEI